MKLYLLIIAIALTAVSQAQVQINEIMAANTTACLHYTRTPSTAHRAIASTTVHGAALNCHRPQSAGVSSASLGTSAVIAVALLFQ